MVLHGEQASLEDIAPDVVEIDVDAIGTMLSQLSLEVACLVVDRGIEPEFLDQPAALVRATGDAHDPASLDLGDLANDRAHRPGGGRDDDGIARLGLSAFEQPEIGGKTRDPVDTHEMGDGLHIRQFGEMLARQAGIVLPPCVGEDHVARTQIVRA